MDAKANGILLQQLEDLQARLAEAEQLIDAIKQGEVDAFAISSNNRSEVFTLQSGDYAYRVLIEKINEGALNLSEDGIILYTNPYFHKLIGKNEQLPTGSYIHSFIHPRSREKFSEIFNDAKRGHGKGEIVLLVDDREIPVYVSLTSLQPKLPTIGMIITDLSEKKQHEFLINQKNIELEDTRTFMQTMIDTSVEQIATFDTNLNFTSVNIKVADYFRMPKEAFIGKNLFSVINVPHREIVEQNMRKALNGETVHVERAPSTFREGLFLETYYIPLIINQKVEGVLTITKDISPVVLAAKQLEHVNKQLEQAQQIAHIGSWEWLYPDRLTWSDELYRIYGLEKTGYTPDFESYLAHIHPDDREMVRNTIHYAAENGKTLNFYHRIARPDGEERIIHGRGEVIVNGKGETVGMAGTAQDVTESRLAKQKLMQTNEELAIKNAELENTQTFLQSVLDSSMELISTLDKSLNYTSVNRQQEIFLGKKREDIIGKNLYELFPAIKNTDYDSYFQRALKGESLHFTNISSFARKNRILETFFIPLVIRNKIEGVLIMAKDITEIKQAEVNLKKANDELELKNQELQQSNAELASFTYIASHDLQEPLRKIQTFSNRILDKEQHNFNETTKNYFHRITSASSRMQSLITALLNYSRTNTSEIVFIKTDLNAVVDEVKNNLSELIESKNVTIHTGDLPVIPVIPHQVYQLFLNLVSNSIKYSRKDVDPVITINCELQEKGKSDLEYTNPDSEYAKLTFTDNGIGFDPQYADRIFELFQRLHTNVQYEGTGIGLAICKRIVQNHKGFIQAVGNPEKGATFTVYLPCSHG